MNLRNDRTRFASRLNSLVACLVLLLPALVGCRYRTVGRLDVRASVLEANAAAREQRPPNVVLVFVDDMGWGDLASQRLAGAPKPAFETPHLDALARAGRRFTDFYVAQPVCGASRAALLTGMYPNRIGLHGAPNPRARHGIHADEVTLAEELRAAGYATGLFGKWHLGHHPPFLPQRHGFDTWFGLPYSNDMWPYHPEKPQDYPPLPLMQGERIVEENPSMDTLSARTLEHTLEFVRAHAERPFFAVLAHAMPHVPLGASEAYRGRTPGLEDATPDTFGHGLYGDVIQEIDGSVGALVAELEALELTEDTLIVFASDNGPWLSYGDHGGSTGGLREGKGTTWEGGVRVPCIAAWPGRIPAGTVEDEPLMTIDVLPTVLGFLGREPTLEVDGIDAGAWFLGTADEAQAAHEALYFYYHQHQLQALRAGRYKLHLPHGYRTLNGRAGGTGGVPVRYEQARTGLELYDLVEDPAETADLSASQPAVVERLLELAERARADLGDSLTERPGPGRRAAGRLLPREMDG